MSDNIRWGDSLPPQPDHPDRPEKIPFLNVKSATELLFLGLPVLAFTHYDERLGAVGATVPCLLDGCKYCSEYQGLEPRESFYSAVALKRVDGKGLLKRILSLTKQAVEPFQNPELIGAFLLLD